MDMNLRIGAVFSLADNSNERNHGNILVKQEPVDADDMHSVTERASSPLSPWHSQYYRDHGIDFDAPPPLSLETDHMPKNAQSISMAPPVLEPVSPILEYGNTTSSRCTGKQRNTPQRKNCKKIDPCYIVLTKVDKYVKPKGSVSYRVFQRKHKECLNICKKVHFRRQLETGRDVFNVKTPSKQWHLEYSYTKRQQKRIIPRRNSRFNFSVKRMGRTNSLKSQKNSGQLQRIRRTVSRVPRDFTERLNSKNDLRHRTSHTIELTEKTLNDLSDPEEIIKRELKRLKKQITLKRAISKRQKPLRKAMMKSTPSYFKPGTSNVSGRIRKTTSKYLNGDFALTADDINYVRVTELEKRRLKKEQRLSREDQIKQLRKEETERQDSKIDVVIDNPEKNRVQKISFLKLDVNNKNDKNCLKVKMPVPERGQTSKRKSLEISEGQQLRPPKQKKTVNSADGVLIQDMPDENHVIRGILQAPKMKDTCENVLGQTEGSQVQAPSVNNIVKSNQWFNTQEMQDDKFKKFKIPSSVQRLFKVKTEPEDPDEVGQQASESDVPKGNTDNITIKSSMTVTVSPIKSSSHETFAKVFTFIPVTGLSSSNSVPACSSGTGLPIIHQSSDSLKNTGTIIFSNTDKRTLNSSGNGIQPSVPVTVPLQQTMGKNMTSLSAKQQVLTTTPLTPTVFLAGSPRMTTTQSHLTSLLNPVRLLRPSQSPPMSMVRETNVTQSPKLTSTPSGVMSNVTVKNSNTTDGLTKFILVNMDGKSIVVPVKTTTNPANAMTSSNSTAATPQHVLSRMNVKAAGPQNTVPQTLPVSSSAQMRVPQFVLSSHNRDPTVKANLVMSNGTPQIAYLNGYPSGPATNLSLRSQIPTLVTSAGMGELNPVPVNSMSGTFSCNTSNGTKKISEVKVVRTETDNISNGSVVVTMSKQQADNDVTNSESSYTRLIKQDKNTGSLKDKRLDPPSEPAETIKEKPKPFAEAVSAREERLRKLKELLKQQTQAVEELRKNKGKV